MEALLVMDKLFSKINLDLPELADIKTLYTDGDVDLAVKSLRKIIAMRISHDLDSDVKTLLERDFYSDIKKTVEVSDQVLRREFIFRNPWDMEKTSKPYIFEKEIKWDSIPFNDVEWCYMLNRHRYWVTLGEAYKLTGNSKYSSGFEEQVNSWISFNPYYKDSMTWRTIEMGLRCENWLKALSLFIDCDDFSDASFVQILMSLYEHGKLLAEHCNNFSLTSNWGVIENHGLYYLGRVLHCFNEAPLWIKNGEERIKKALDLQVYEDGIHWEQSSLYHCEVLRSLISIISIDRKIGVVSDSKIRGVAQKMLHSLIYISTPDNKTPLNGDSDSIYIGELLSEAALLLKNPHFKSRGLQTFGYENLFYYGLKGFDEYRLLESRVPETCSIALDYSHNYVMRSSWESDAHYLMFNSGPIGGGHGHIDLLHFTLYGYGREFLTDSGRYTYMEKSPYRELLKCGKAHNTIIIDGKDFTEYVDSWTYKNITRGMGQIWKSSSDYDYVEASHTGYMFLEHPVFVTRKILFVKNLYWILCDQITGRGEHSVERYFHTGDNSLKEIEGGVVTDNNEGANLIIKPLRPHERMEIKDSVRSPEYNILTPSSLIKSYDKIDGFDSFTTLLYPTERAGESVTITPLPVFDRFEKEIPRESAEAMKISFGMRGEEHIVFIVHQGNFNQTDSYIVDGKIILGELVLIKRSMGQEKVLKIK